MKVRELIEKLQEFDQDMDVEVYYTYPSGCCSYNYTQDDDTFYVGTVELATEPKYMKAPGPRGGAPKMRRVDVPIVRLSE